MAMDPSGGQVPEDVAPAPAAPGGFSSGAKIAIAAAGALVLVLGGVLIGSRFSGEEDLDAQATPTAETPAVPGLVESEPVESVPPEARSFVEQFGNRYTDPVATYYSEIAYETAGDGSGAIIPQELIDGYASDTFKDGTESFLGGMEYLSLPFETNIVDESAEASAQFFNNSAVLGCMNRYMNLVAKNSSAPEAINIINDQFLYYCGNDSLSGGDLGYVQNLMNSLRSVTETYGSNANYSIAPAGADNDSQEGEGTSFTKYGDYTVIDSLGNDDQVLAFSNIIDLVVNVDTYDGENDISHTQETLESVQFSVVRIPPVGPVDPGRVVIGIK